MPEPPQMLFLWFQDGKTAGVHTVPPGTFGDQNPFPESFTIRYRRPSGIMISIDFGQDSRQANRYVSMRDCPYL